MAHDLERIVVECGGNSITVPQQAGVPVFGQFVLGESELKMYGYAGEGRGAVVISSEDVASMGEIVKEVCKDPVYELTPDNFSSEIKSDAYCIVTVEYEDSEKTSYIRVKRGNAFHGRIMVACSDAKGNDTIEELTSEKYFELEHLNMEQSKEQNIPIYVVFSDKKIKKVQDLKEEKYVSIVPRIEKSSDDSDQKEVHGSMYTRMKSILSKTTLYDGDDFKYEVEADPDKGICEGEIFKVIGGGMGVIFKARRVYDDGRKGTDVAIKLFHQLPSGRDGKQYRRETMREIETLYHACFDTQFIVQVNYKGEMDGNHPFFEMEIGTPLDTKVIDNPEALKKEDIIQIARDMCEGVHHLYNNVKIRSESGRIKKTRNLEKTVHRDIKMKNILLFMRDGMWRAKLADFGFAKATVVDIGSISRSQTKLGANIHCAPECFLDAKLINPSKEFERECRDGNSPYKESTDLYSIGVCLYQMIAGTEVTESLQCFQTPDNKLKKELVDVIEIPRDRRVKKLSFTERQLLFLEGVIKKCMQPLPSERYKTAKELLHDLTVGWNDIVSIGERRKELVMKCDALDSRLSEISKNGDINCIVDGLARGDLRQEMLSIACSYVSVKEDLGDTPEEETEIAERVIRSISVPLKDALQFLDESKFFKNGKYSSDPVDMHVSDVESDACRSRKIEDVRLLEEIVDAFSNDGVKKV